MPDTPLRQLPSELAVARLIRSTNRGFGQCLQASLARFGFSSGMWHFLRVLNEEDGITQRELSQRAGTVEPTAMKQLERMERSGLIRRTRDGEDKRKIRIHLTEQGRDLFRTLNGPATAIPRAALAGLSPSEIDTLVKSLTHIQKNLDAYAAAIPPLTPSNN
jgi:MarR family transcriptional regulator, organic hydroperoxide resistance regulator